MEDPAVAYYANTVNHRIQSCGLLLVIDEASCKVPAPQTTSANYKVLRAAACFPQRLSRVSGSAAFMCVLTWRARAGGGVQQRCTQKAAGRSQRINLGQTSGRIACRCRTCHGAFAPSCVACGSSCTFFMLRCFRCAACTQRPKSGG